MMTLARLRSVRQRQALTQQQLAEKAGLNRATIVRLEAGADEPLPTTVRKLASALGVEPADLIRPAADLDSSFPHRLSAFQPSRNAPSADGLLGADDRDVRRLLRQAPGLADLVHEAEEQLAQFIPDARLTLEVLTDPEFGDSEELFLGVCTSLPDDQADAALEKFDKEWWLHNVHRARGLLCIDLVFE